MATKKTNYTTLRRPVSATKTHIMVTLPPETRKQIEDLAYSEDRSLSYLCRRFIEQGLNTHKQ
jgi:predicted DNA-binding protein